jgi:hypothetical protein
MKMRTIKLTAQTLTDALQGKTAPAPNLPPDTELLDIKFDLLNNEVIIIVRSDSFEDIPEKYPIPELNITTATYTKAAPQISPQPISSPKVEPSRKPQAQSNLQATKIAEEFSPEQRKLLSFTVSGDTVIIKPIQFLKEEWEDINETVRSLGGRWVKGDIVSYWAIPI